MSCVTSKLLSFQKNVISITRLPLKKHCCRARSTRPTGLPHLEKKNQCGSTVLKLTLLSLPNVKDFGHFMTCPIFKETTAKEPPTGLSHWMVKYIKDGLLPRGNAQCWLLEYHVSEPSIQNPQSAEPPQVLEAP